MSKQDFLKQFDDLTALFPIQGKARATIHNGLDFPTTRDEYWKYTRVNAIVNASYARNAMVVDDVEQYKTRGLDAYYLVFVNGEFSDKLSDQDIPKGVQADAMKQVSGERKERMLSHLDKYVNSQEHAFHALNTSYFVDGAFVTVDENAVIEKPICVLHINAGKHQASNVRNLFLVGKSAQAKFITQYEGVENEGSFTNVVTELAIGENAHASLYLTQEEGDTTSHVNTTQVVQEQHSVSKVVTVTKNGKLVRNNLNFTVKGEGCESNMYGIYFTSGNQHVDNHTYVDHLVPNCNSNELYKGVMTDRSTGVFNGKIMVHKDAQQTNAFQSNQNILLSDRASVNTKPELEIYADDVKCSHGCTIGQLDEEARFYLQSRGLGKEAATMLLVQAFAGEVLEQIEVEALHESVASFIHSKFNALDA